MTHKPGDVVLIPFPFTDQSTRKRRPVLILSNLDDYGDFLAVAITSQPGHINAIALADTDFQQGTLPKPSWLRAARIFTLNRQNIAGVFGRLTPHALKHLHAQVCDQLGCGA